MVLVSEAQYLDGACLEGEIHLGIRTMDGTKRTIWANFENPAEARRLGQMLIEASKII
jgi:hypothetical protein